MVSVPELEEKLSAVSITADVSSTMHLEVRLKKGASKRDVEECKELITQAVSSLEELYNWRSFVLAHPKLDEKIDQILIGCPETPDGQKLILSTSAKIAPSNVHVYNVKDIGVLPSTISTDDSESTVGSHHWELPCQEFDDLWENLVFDDNIKNELLSFVYALLKLSDRGANSSVLSVNRMVLLHGPPGTGKTSLCKALAQRLAIRLNGRYKRAILIEVNSHSLFSKWFAESGKLIMKLFEQIEECASDSKQLVFVLIDEVESLTIGRNSTFKGNDPSDSLRSVNAVLTQMDKIRRFRNVLVLNTSNLTDALDEAFIDRADMNRFVGHPSAYAIYSILSSAIKEMQRVNLVDPAVVLNPVGCYPNFNATSVELLHLSSHCVGLSGRTVRKLPVLAYSKCAKDFLTMPEFVKVLDLAIKEKTMPKTVNVYTVPTAHSNGHNQHTNGADETTSTM